MIFRVQKQTAKKIKQQIVLCVCVFLFDFSHSFVFGADGRVYFFDN